MWTQYSVSQWQWWSANRLSASLLYPCGLTLFFKRPLTIPPYKPTQLVCKMCPWVNEKEEKRIFFFGCCCSGEIAFYVENIRAVIISVAFALCLMDFSLNTLFIPFPLLFPSSFRLSLAIFFLICQIFSKKKIAIFARWTCSDASAFLLKLHWLYKEFHFKCDKGVKKKWKTGKRKGVCSLPESLFNRN